MLKCPKINLISFVFVINLIFNYIPNHNLMYISYIMKNFDGEEIVNRRNNTATKSIEKLQYIEFLWYITKGKTENTKTVIDYSA